MRKLSLALVFILLLNNITTAQDFTSALASFNSKNPQEKIFIHFDKDNYVAGESIWFKAYLTDGGMPSTLSTNFYLQLSDAQGKLIESKKYPINGATVRGNIDLWDSIPQGAYTITAFTPASLNFTEDNLLFKKNVFIYNPAVRKAVASPSPLVSIVFFPESGNLLDGVLTTVAFKAVDQWGKPVEVSGMIKANDGFNIPFKTYHDGIGRVSFKPRASKTYVGTIDNSPAEFNFPKVEKSGINLHVDDEKGGKVFTITRTETDKNNFQKLTVVAQINNQVVYEQEIDFEDYPSLKGHLVTDKLHSGILHFTVFNKDGAPLAERLCFVDNKEYLADADIVAIRSSLTKRAENNFEIISKDSAQKSLSLAVADVNAVNLLDRESIVSRFLLTSDLKGRVYNPAWYFEKNDSVKLAIDNLMLTHGWTRFNWKKIMAGQFADKKYEDPYLITVAGTVRDEKGNSVKGGELTVYLLTEDSSTQSFEVKVDPNGRFLLDSVLFYGTAKLHYTYVSGGKERKASLIADSTAGILVYNNQKSGVFEAAQLSMAELTKRYQFSRDFVDKVKELETVTVKTAGNKKPFDEVNEKYSSGSFKTAGRVNFDNINQPTPNKTINPVDFALNNIRQLGLQNGKLVNNKTLSLSSGERWAVAVFLDESPADLSALRNYRMDEIALIKFYEPGFVGAGSNGPGGALAVYTKGMKQEDEKYTKKDFVLYKGYSITKEFYSPDYSKQDPRNDVADYRSTLYWNPSVFFDRESNIQKFSFFNNDYSKRLRVVVEGFTADGRLIHIEKILE